MKRGAVGLLRNAVYPVAVTAVAVVIWYVAALSAKSEFIVPTPARAARAFFLLFGERAFWRALSGTLLRALVAFFASLIVAVLAAAAGIAFLPVRKFLSPVISVLRALPTTAIVLLVAIWAGSKAAPVIVALAVIMPTLYSAFLAALDGVPRDAIDMARLDGAGKRVLVSRFYLPLALPAAARPASGTLSLCVKLTVAAEILAGTARSVGMEMQRASIYFDTARLMAFTVATVIVALILEHASLALLHRLFGKQEN